MKVYVASSWRTPRHDEVVRALRDAGHDVYDYRQDGANHEDFGMDYDHTLEETLELLAREDVESVVDRDMNNVAKAKALVLVLPCGRSAHTEYGFALAIDKPCYILWEACEPEFVYLGADCIVGSVQEIVECLS